MKKQIAAMLVGMGLTVGIYVVFQADSITAAEKADDEKSRVAKFMQAKLSNSQSVLEGLVTEDFQSIEDGAQKMKVMSLAADWQLLEGPVYAQYSAEFRRSADRLVKMAKEKNTDGAALSYVHLTLTCISCHKFVRSVQMANGEEVPAGLERALRQEKELLLTSTRGE